MIYNKLFEIHWCLLLYIP